MSMLPLIINLIAGGVGGNVIGAIFKKISLGGLGNTIAGAAGGGLGGGILSALGFGGAAAASQSTGLDVGSLLGSVAGGGVGGGVLMTIIGFIRSMMNR